MPNLVRAQELMSENFKGSEILIILIFTMIGLFFLLVVCWVNFEQIRQLGKLYKEMKRQVGKEVEYGDTKLVLSDFHGVMLKTNYMVILASVFLVAAIFHFYIGYRVTAIIQVFLLYFPIWKLTKSDGLTVSQIRGWSIVNKVLFVWVCIKAVLIVLVTILGVLGMTLAALINI